MRIILYLVSIISAQYSDDDYNRFCVVMTGDPGSVCIRETGVCSSSSDVNCSDAVVAEIEAKYNIARARVLNNLNLTFEKTFEFVPQIQLNYSEFLKYPKRYDQAGIELDNARLGEYLSGSVEAIRALISIYLEIPGVNWAIRTFDIYQLPLDIQLGRDSAFNADDGEYLLKWMIASLGLENQGIPEALVEYEIKPLIASSAVEALQKVQAYVVARTMIRLEDKDLFLLDEAVRDALRAIDVYRGTRDADPILCMSWYVWLYDVMTKHSIASFPHIFQRTVIGDISSYNRFPHMTGAAALLAEENFFTATLVERDTTVDWDVPVVSTDIQSLTTAILELPIPKIKRTILLRVLQRMVEEYGSLPGVSSEIFASIPVESRDMAVQFLPEKSYFLDTVRCLMIALTMNRNRVHRDEMVTLIRLVRTGNINLEAIEQQARSLRDVFVRHELSSKYSNPYDVFGEVRSFPYYASVASGKTLNWFMVSIRSYSGMSNRALALGQADAANQALEEDLANRRNSAMFQGCMI